MLSGIELKEREDFYGKIFSNFESVKKRYKYLWPCLKYDLCLREFKKLGFENPEKIILSEPWILGLSVDDILKKINFLKKIGFKKPVSVLELNPKILDFSINNIKNKIKGLKEIGLKDPCRVFVLEPKLICHSTESLKQKIEVLELYEFENIETLVKNLCI